MRFFFSSIGSMPSIKRLAKCCVFPSNCRYSSGKAAQRRMLAVHPVWHCRILSAQSCRRIWPGISGWIPGQYPGYCHGHPGQWLPRRQFESSVGSATAISAHVSLSWDRRLPPGTGFGCPATSANPQDLRIRPKRLPGGSLGSAGTWHSEYRLGFVYLTRIAPLV